MLVTKQVEVVLIQSNFWNNILNLISLQGALAACIMLVEVVIYFTLLSLADIRLRYKCAVKLFHCPPGNRIELTPNCPALLWNCFLHTSGATPPYLKDTWVFIMRCGWTHNTTQSQQRRLRVEHFFAFSLTKVCVGNCSENSLNISQTIKPKHILHPLSLRKWWSWEMTRPGCLTRL